MGTALGALLLSRGAVLPARADGGLPVDAVERAGAALAYGLWSIQTLVQAWHRVVQQEGWWHAHYHAAADNALPTIGLAVGVAVGAVGIIRRPQHSQEVP